MPLDLVVELPKRAGRGAQGVADQQQVGGRLIEVDQAQDRRRGFVGVTGLLAVEAGASGTDWSSVQPPGRDTRHETLRRLAELLRGPWGSFTRFAQASQAAMSDLSATEEYTRRMDAIGELLAPGTDPVAQLRGRLALAALFIAVSNDGRLGSTIDQRTDAALEVAFALTR